MCSLGREVDTLSALLLMYVALTLALPYVLSGDRGLTSFLVYVLLSSLAIVTAFLRLKRWAELE